MKKSIFVILFCVICIFVPTVSCAENLIRNSDFSMLDDKGEIADWATCENKYSKVKVLDDALCIENNITTYSEVSQMVKVKPNKYYKVSAKVKILRESNSGAYLSIKVFTDAIKSQTKIVRDKSNDYETITMYGKTGEEQYAVTLNLCLGEEKNESVGKALFKDIEFSELDYVPEGYEEWYINFTKSKMVQITIELISKLIFASFCIGVVYFVNKNINEKLESVKQSIRMKDIAIMGILTLAYLGLALYNLGDKKIPDTGWSPKTTGEYVIIELPKMTKIQKIKYFEGLNDREPNKGAYKLQYLDEETDDNEERYHILKRDGYNVFKWKEIREDTKAKTIKIEVLQPGIDLREIAIYERGGAKPIEGLKILEDKTEGKMAYKLIDEQNLAKREISYKNQTIFDEVFYVRTGYEYLNKMEGFEVTHPPLGKIFLALGIKIFGMNPFGWRIIGTIFGAFMIPAMYLFSKKIFHKSFYATMGAILLMFDCMHFTQTRTSLIDSYSVFFIILMYYYMIDLYMNDSKKVDKNYTKSMILSGIFFSLGAATKWTVVYGGLGLFTFYSISFYKNLLGNKKEAIKSLLLGVSVFVVLPILTYLVVYMPVFGKNYTIASVFSEVKNMFLFHKDESITHTYASKWYEWFVIFRPMLFYCQVYGNGTISKIYTRGNPLIWWISFIAVVYSAIRGYKNKDNIVWIFVIGYIFQYLPWMFITRTTFIYHYFSAIPFAIFAIIYMLKNTCKRKYIYVYVLAVIIAFCILYPSIAGVKTNFRLS